MDTKTGVNIWGSKKLADNVAVAKNAVKFSAIIPENTYTDIELSDKTTDDVIVKWLSSDENIISTTGKVTAPSSDTEITLTARLSKGNCYYDKIYKTTVKAGGISSADIETGLAADYDFEGDGFLNKANNIQRGTAMALSAGTKPSIEYNSEHGSKVLHQYFGFPAGNSTSYVQFPNPLKGKDINGATVSLWVNRTNDDVWDAIWSFFDKFNIDGRELEKRLFLTPNAYLGFNAVVPDKNDPEKPPEVDCWFDCHQPNSIITNKISINEWNLITVSMDSSGFGIYINGELVFTESKNEAFGKGEDFTGYQLVIDLIKSSANFYLGYGSFWGSSPLLMDNLKIYERSLTEADVAKLYAAEREEVKENLESGDGYIAEVGNDSYNLEWYDYTKFYGTEVTGDFQIKYNFHNSSQGTDVWQNYAVALTTDLASTKQAATDWYVRADNWSNSNFADTTPEYSDTYGSESLQKILKEADIDLTVTRIDKNITIKAVITCSDRKTYVRTATAEGCPTDDMKVYLGGQDCHLEIYDVQVLLFRSINNADYEYGSTVINNNSSSNDKTPVYQWYKSDIQITPENALSLIDGTLSGATAINEATNKDYQIQADDVGKYIAVVVTTENGKPVTVSTLPDKVQKKKLSISESVAQSKIYDGTVDATISSVKFTGIVGNDDIAYDTAAKFIDANAGTEKEITGTVTLKEASADLYILENDKFTTKADIEKSAVTPNMPETSINVPNTKKKIGDITLPTDWIWLAGDAEKEIPEDSVIKATAIYNGADKGNYVTESVEITIQKVDCVHEEKETRNEKQATCTEAGYSGDIYCTFCGILISEGNIVEAIGHDYEVVIIKPATATENGIQEKTCKRCGDNYTEEIPKTGTDIPTPTPTLAGSTSTPSPTGSGSGGSSGGGAYIPAQPITPNQPGPGTGSSSNPGTSQVPAPSVVPSASPVPSATPAASQTPAPGTDIKVDEETGAVTETTTSTDGNKTIVTEKVIMPDGSESVKETVTEDTGALTNVTETLTDSSTNSVLVTKVTSDNDGNVINASAVVYTGDSDTASQYSVKTVIPKSYFENVKDAGLASVDIYVEKPTVDSVKEKTGPKMLIKIAVPDVGGVSVGKVIVTKDSIESAKGSSKKLVVKIQNENPSKSYTVTIPQSQLKKMNQEINVSVKTGKVSGMGSSNKKKINKILSSNKAGEDNSYTMSIASNNTKGGIKVTTPALLPSAKQGDKVYVYSYNKKTGKLEEVPNSQTKVIKDSEVAVEGFSGNTYVITDKELSGKKVVKLLDKAKVSVGKASVKKGGKTKVKLDLGTGLVAKPSVKSSTPYAKQAAVVTYKSSNPKKVKVSKNGTITAKGKGKAEITVKIKLAGGKVKKVKKNITVK
ncbi:MAG: YDG domain-containing protein [Lachnospiraceae bacterium]|nr:YDG domain-containing protein [Lachnospiraceae bacterium]